MGRLHSIRPSTSDLRGPIGCDSTTNVIIQNSLSLPHRGGSPEPGQINLVFPSLLQLLTKTSGDSEVLPRILHLSSEGLSMESGAVAWPAVVTDD